MLAGLGVEPSMAALLPIYWFDFCGCPTQGVQFHPESIITEDGKRIVGNFIKTLLPEI